LTKTKYFIRLLEEVKQKLFDNYRVPKNQKVTIFSYLYKYGI